MAIPGSIGKDNLNISFRLNSKTNVFDGSSNALVNAKVNIVGSASSFGLVFVGSSNAEIFVICTKDLELPTALDQNAPVRKIPMPSPVTQLATNCDGSILAVDVKINGVPHIQMYSVPSFLTPNIQKISELRLSADNANSTQLCWNPVINSILAVCTESGGLNLYSFKEQGVAFHNIDPSLKAKCCCWSPKGKQIVAGFMNGRIMQFNMELKPARTIECPPTIFPGGNFDVIAIQWLSTYQFAIAFLSHQEAARPILHILNAPKAGPPQYIVYNDVCYSTSEIRPSKMYLQYIQQWGMLLVASANCVDVSFLRICKPGDIPEWMQEFPNDQFPAEMPLTPEKDESFPVGFEFETACTNKLLQEDGNPYPVMPMIHLVSTYGVLCSFYILNTTSTYVDVCSPPRPIDPRVQSLFTVNVSANVVKSQPQRSVFQTPTKIEAPAPISTSTPAVLPKTNLFGSVPNASPFSLAPQSQSNAFSGFSMPPSSQQQQVKPQPVTMPFQMPASKPVIAPTQPIILPVQAVPQNQPLITVPPTYNPQMTQQKTEVKEIAVSEKLTDAEDELIYLRMIQDEMKAFELELNFIMEKSKSLKVNIGTKEESAEMRRKLEELDELKKEANETVESLRSDIQTNRLGLTEMFSMVYEAKSKMDQANNERSIIKPHNQIQDRSIKRTLDTLKKMISQCEMQIQVVIQLLNSQWANYQDSLGRNKKNKMHVPSLESVYQTLTKQQEIVYNLSAKINLLKTKLGICDDVKKQKNANVNNTIESLSDSIISMSLIDQVQNENSKLTSKKLNNLLNYLNNREVVTIKPQRPKLPGLNSEIVIEKKIQAIKNLKRPEPKRALVPQQKELVPQPKPIPVVPNIPKTQPSESVYDFSSMQQQSAQKPPIFTPVTNTATQPQLSFAKKPEEPTKTSGFSFGSALQTVPQSNFGLSLSTSTKSGLNLSTSSNPMNFGNSSMPPPSFTPSGFATNLSAEKRKEDSVTITKIPQAVPKTTVEAKPISNANLTVSANFSVPLPPKTSPSTVKEISKVEEKKKEEPKPLTTNETASFTFSLPGKKESPASNKPASVITFGNSPSTASDNVKSAFSFGSAPNAFSFGSASKTNEVKPQASTTSSTSIFSGGSSSFGFGDAAKVTSSGTTSIFAAALSTPQIPKTVEDLKVSPSSVPTIASSSSSAPLFGISTSASPPSDSKSSFSFANFGASITSTVSEPVSSITTQSATVFAQKSDTNKTQAVSSSTPADSSTITPPPSNVVQSSTADSVLQGLNICSPITTLIAPPAPTNIFASPLPPTKTETSSFFGSSSFATGFGSPSVATTKSTIFSTPTSTVTTTVSSSTPVTSTTPSESIFGQAVKTTQAFGGLDLSTKSPTNTAFGQSSLVKPDQSVFGQNSVTVTSTPATTETFSNIFAAAAANLDSKPANTFGSTPVSSPSNIFGTATTQVSSSTSNVFATQQSPQGSIFGQTQPSQPSQGSIFGQAAATTSSNSVFGQATSTTPSGSVFGQATTTASTGSIFSQGSFSSPNTTGNIFSGTSQTQSPFGAAPSSSVFGSGSQPSQQSTSIFGSSSAFGQTASAQPSSNIFGSAAAPNTQTSPFGGNIFTQNQAQSSFGGNATFSNNFGQSSFGSGGSIFTQQQNQPVFGGGATFGSPKSNIFGGTVPSPPQSPQQGNNIFEQLGQQQSGNLFGSLAQATQPPQQQGGFIGSAFSSWR